MTNYTIGDIEYQHDLVWDAQIEHEDQLSCLKNMIKDYCKAENIIAEFTLTDFTVDINSNDPKLSFLEYWKKVNVYALPELSLNHLKIEDILEYRKEKIKSVVCDYMEGSPFQYKIYEKKGVYHIPLTVDGELAFLSTQTAHYIVGLTSLRIEMGIPSKPTVAELSALIDKMIEIIDKNNKEEK